MSLESLINEKTVKSVFVSGIEAYGTHVSRIELFDLFSPTNTGTDWTVKQGKASFNPLKATTQEVKTIQDCFDKINVKFESHGIFVLLFFANHSNVLYTRIQF